MALSSTDMIIFGGAIATFAIVAVVVIKGAGGKMQKRIERVTDRKRSASSTQIVKNMEPSSLRRQQGDSSLPLLKRLVDALPTLSALRTRLERAGKKISAERYIAYSAGLFAVVTLAVQLGVHKGILLSLLIGIIVGVGVPHFLLNIWAAKRLKAFIGLFPDAIDLIVRGLRSGLPVSESVKLVSQEVPDPVGPTFQMMADTMKLGVPMEKILTDTAEKMHCTEFNFFVTSIILQRETGGNLSEILNNLSDVLRKRFMMKMKIRAMTSEARASMYIIGSLPFIVLAAVAFMTPGYIDPLIHDYRGNIAAAGAFMSLCTGIGIMAKMSKFEI